MAAKLKEDPFNPDRWHSITVEVKMGTMSTDRKDGSKYRYSTLHNGKD